MPEVTNDELMDMIIADKSPSQVSDKIKDILFSKSAEKVDAFKPQVATNSFNAQEPEPEVESEVENSPEEVPAEE